jgi:putative resolvase
MRLKIYAQKVGVSYITAYRYFKSGLIKGTQLPTGTILIDDSEATDTKQTGQTNQNKNRVVLYARVSSAENKDNLHSQLERLRNFASNKGYIIIKEIEEVGSGINDKRRKLISLLKNTKLHYNIILSEHSDRFSRFGIGLIETLLKRLDIKIEFINTIEDRKDRITQDLIDIITSFSAKIYGLRRSRRVITGFVDKLKDGVP